MHPSHQLARRIVARFLVKADSAVLDSKDRSQINAALLRAGMGGGRKFRSPGDALGIIAEQLGDFGVEFSSPVMKSDVAAESGRLTIDLSKSSPDKFSPSAIRNTSLAFHWTDLGSGFEVVAYLG